MVRPPLGGRRHFSMLAAAVILSSSGSILLMMSQLDKSFPDLDVDQQPPPVDFKRPDKKQEYPPANPKSKHPIYELLADNLRTNISNWSPLVYSTCDASWMPELFAPCLDIPGENIVKQELVYPDFRIRIPHFVNNQDGQYWLKEAAIRPQFEDNWGMYKGQYGQNIVYPGGTYTGMPTSGWHESSCMNSKVSHQLKRENADGGGGAETVVIASAPDVHSFQHFLDRGTHIILQSEPHFTNDTRVWFSSRLPQSTVKQILEGLSTQLYPHAGGSISASKRVIFSCRAPLIHPYLSLRLLERLHVRPLPIRERKIVLYVGRKNSRNKGRNVRNEDRLFEGIRHLLATRMKNETLVYFDHTEWPTLQDMIPYFSNVAAVIGPHGGSFFNHRWAGRDTLVMEFVPKSRFSMMFWEEASILNQNYWAILLDTTGNHDMIAPVNEVVNVLDKHLGEPLDHPSLEHYYPWKIGE